MKELPTSKQKLAQLHDMLHTDQTGLAAGLETVLKTVAGYRWVADGRGPYEWDDAQYRKEMGVMLDAIHKGAEQALARWKAGGIPRPCCKLCESPDETPDCQHRETNPIADTHATWCPECGAFHDGQQWIHPWRAEKAVETTKPQFDPLRNFVEWVLGAHDCPGMVAHIIDNARGALEQASGKVVETAALCPHGFVLAENICGPCSEGRPNRPAAKAAESWYPCGCLVGTICPHRHANSMCDGLITDPETGLKSVCPECYSKKAAEKRAYHETHEAPHCPTCECGAQKTDAARAAIAKAAGLEPPCDCDAGWDEDGCYLICGADVPEAHGLSAKANEPRRNPLKRCPGCGYMPGDCHCSEKTPAPLTVSGLDGLIAEADKYILPVDVKIGSGTFRKGVKVGTMLRGLKSHAEKQTADAYSSSPRNGDA